MTVELWSPELGWSPRVIVHGSYGRPVVVFPSSEGRAEDYASNGMVEAVRPLIDQGRVTRYCVDSWDSGSWYRDDLELEERAQRHEAYERWVIHGVVPFIDADCGGRQPMLTTGCSFGAFHAVNLALRQADLFPFAIGLSGVYDLAAMGWGRRGDCFHVNNPMDAVGGLHGEHLSWLQPAAVAVARRRARDVGGQHRSAREHPLLRCAVRLEGTARRDRHLGP